MHLSSMARLAISRSSYRSRLVKTDSPQACLLILLVSCPPSTIQIFSFLPPACGDDGARTRDLVVANHALSQLSYIPLVLSRNWAYLDSNQGPQLYQSCALAN